MVCSDHRLSEIHVACIRDIWRAGIPLCFLALLTILRFSPGPSTKYKIVRRIKRSFTPFLTIRDAELLVAHDNAVTSDAELKRRRKGAIFRLSAPISVLSLCEVLAWSSLASYAFMTQHTSAWMNLALAISWLFTALRLLIKPSMTPPYDILCLLVIQLCTATVCLAAIWYNLYASGKGWPGGWELSARLLDVSIISALLAIILRTPVELPGKDVDTSRIGVDISPEDYATLWGWMTFGFVDPLIKKGTETVLNEGDVWEISPHHRAAPLLSLFMKVKGKTLLRRIWVANSFDLIMDGLLTLVSVVFNYAGPFFLKRILDAISDPSPHSLALAYTYAFLTFMSSLIKNQADMQHLWFGRQAVTRTRSILMGAVYDKALKRRDFSGATDPKGGGAGGANAKISIRKAALESIGKRRGEGGNSAKPGADLGKIVNLMSGDASKVSQILGQVYNLYGAPFEIMIASVFLYQLLGFAAFFGFFALLSVAPLNHMLSKRRIFISRGISAARDRRMAVVNELFVSVKFIKLCAWDEKWIERCEKARAKEIKWIMRERWNTILLASLWTSAPILVSVFSFFAFVAQGKELTVSIAFTSIVLFNLLRQPLNVLPNFLAQLLQARVALDRISAFFSEEEVEDFVSTLKQKTTPSSDATSSDLRLGIIGGARFAWNSADTQMDKPAASNAAPPNRVDNQSEVHSDSGSSSDEPRFELRDINIIFPPGKLTLVTGPTASGKTALLMAQLGEMTMLHHSTNNQKILLPKFPSEPLDENGLRPSISFAAQSPWLEHRSIRDNILFGEPFDVDRYWDVIESCALKADLDLLEDGDWTEIGERGISLSGGQKARVALARAVYARSKVVLLDDPLSAVDSHTARFLYERLFRGPLLQNRTVVLVTHHVELVLPAAHYFIEMQDGRINIQGTVHDLRQRGILEDFQVELISEEPESNLDEDEVGIEERWKGRSGSISLRQDIDWIVKQKAIEGARKKPRKLVEDESRETGNVKWIIYDTYLKATGYFAWLIILLLIAVSQLFGFFEKYWIKVWGEAYGDIDISIISLFSGYSGQEILAGIQSMVTRTVHPLHVNPFLYEVNSATLPSPHLHPLFYVAIYSAIGFGGVIITTIGTIVQYEGAVKASRTLFSQLLNGLVHATMRWHDITPTGRILNRLSRDMEVLDSSLSNSLRAVIFRLATFIASILTVAYVFPSFLIPAAIISFFYVRISRGYINAGRDMRRMQSTTRSPIFAGFAETLEGIVTVRAFGAERRFLESQLEKIDLTTKMWYGFWMMNRWLLLRFDALGALSIFVITLFALSGYISSGWAGITITSAMQFTVSVYWTCRLATQLELDLNSVERVVEYLDLPQEPPGRIEGREVPESWPCNSVPALAQNVGQRSRDSQHFIQVKDLVIKYSPELPPVLHNVSFTLKVGEKVGLLGRTGSGKSTLAMSLLRFVEPASGNIIIDGLDICTIGLNDLRSKVTIIPQDSVLFSGSLRENLDPFEDYQDSECLDALYRVHLLSPGAGIPRSQTNSGVTLPALQKPTPTRLITTLLDRPLTPEPDSINATDTMEVAVDRSRLFPTETLLVPAIGHTGGTVTPTHMGTLGWDGKDGFAYNRIRRDSSGDANALIFRFGGGMESGIASPTGALSPSRATFNLGSTTINGGFRYGMESGIDTPARLGGLDSRDEISQDPVRDGRVGPATEERADGRNTASGTETMLLTLDTRVASGGSNFSNGQRQLISMARALLRRNSVVILDEATSSIDFETDAKIQSTVREEFKNSCLLTIAHRIRTVIDYDRLIVLDKGRIVEFDTPWSLIQKEGGLFRDMCAKSGQMRELEAMAKAKFLGGNSRWTVEL